MLEDDGTLEALAHDTKAKHKSARSFRVRAAQSLLKAADNPRLIARTLEQMGDRLEGRPVQKVETHRKRTVIFYEAGAPPPELGRPSTAPLALAGSSSAPGADDVVDTPVVDTGVAINERSIAAPAELRQPLPPARRLSAEVQRIARAGTEEPAP